MCVDRGGGKTVDEADMGITSRGDLTTGQTPPAARAAKHPDRIDATPVPLVASASAGGEMTH